MRVYRFILILLIVSAPLINFSLIPGSKLPVFYLTGLAGFILVVIISHKVPREAIGIEDLLFLAFLVCGLVSYKLNSEAFPEGRGLTQIVNLLLTYVLFKIAWVVMIRCEIDAVGLLRKIFTINSFIQLLAIFVFAAGLIKGQIFEQIAEMFNNSGNFHIGAVGVSWHTARSFGFSPEPSFWSFFIAMNIALAFVIPETNKALLGINFLNLLLTLGRTGFLMLLVILIVRFSKRSAATKFFLVVTAGVAVLIFSDYLVVENFRSVDISIRQRLDSIFAGFDVFMHHPLFGIGFGNFPVYAAAQQYDFFDIFNLFLSVLVSSGILGTALFLGTLVMIFRKVRSGLDLPFYAAVVGWLTVSAYNLPFVWLIFAALLYASVRVEREANRTFVAET